MASPPASADKAREADVYFKTRLDAVIDILQKRDLDRELRKQQVTDIILPVFDFELIGKLSLGREHWSAMTAAQRKRFHALFVERLKTTYLDTMLLYTDERIAYKPTVLQGDKVHIPSELISKNAAYAMVYKLYPVGDAWRIYDVEIEGVSIVKSYRTQFDSVLRSGTMEDLLKRLESPDEIK